MVQQIQLASGTMGWFDGIKETISSLALGGGLLIGAGGVAYLTRYIPKQYKPIGYIGALGLGVGGAYALYKGFTEKEFEKAKSTDKFPIYITDPSLWEEWSIFLPHSVNVQVNNPYDAPKKVYVGMSMISDETGQVTDFPLEPVELKAGETKKLSWWHIHSTIGKPRGLYWVVSSVWDVSPKPPCEAQGTCHRLGTAESSVIFKWFG